MPAFGYIQAKAYTSRAKLPLEDAAVSVVDENGRLLGLRTTNSSGMTTPIRLEVPDAAQSQSPGNGRPFVTVNLYARAEGFEQIENENLQVFPNTVTRLNLEMIPLSELPSSWDKTIRYDTPKQNL